MDASSSFSGSPQSSSTAKVSFGAYDQSSGQLVGKTVGEVRAQQGRLWNAPADAVAMVGNSRVDDSYVIQENDHLILHRKSGEKGI